MDVALILEWHGQLYFERHGKKTEYGKRMSVVHVFVVPETGARVRVFGVMCSR